jgi:hypothetical protein
VKKLLMVVGLSMIGVLMFASAASAACAIRSASASGSASASSGCNDTWGFGSASSLSVPAWASTPKMPATGGLSPALALVPLALIVGGGLLAFSIVRRR